MDLYKQNTFFSVEWNINVFACSVQSVKKRHGKMYRSLNFSHSCYYIYFICQYTYMPPKSITLGNAFSLLGISLEIRSVCIKLSCEDNICQIWMKHLDENQYKQVWVVWINETSLNPNNGNKYFINLYFGGSMVEHFWLLEWS